MQAVRDTAEGFLGKALYSVSALVIAAVVVGWYADSDPLYSVNGDVTAGGERVGYGTVAFYPREKRGKSSYGAAIVDGRFSIPKKEGLPPGSYRVEIVGFRETGMPMSGRAGEGGERTARLPITRTSPASIQVPEDIRQVLGVECDVHVE